MAALIRTLTMLATGCFEMALVAKVHKRAKALIDLKNYASATAAVPAIRAPFRDILSPEKANDTVSAISCFYKYLGFINKHAFTPSCPLPLAGCSLPAAPCLLSALGSLLLVYPLFTACLSVTRYPKLIWVCFSDPQPSHKQRFSSNSLFPTKKATVSCGFKQRYV
jgi:hypothetical protein